VEVDGGFDSNLLRRLQAGDLDFVVAELPLERAGAFRFELLTSDDLVAVARPEHPLAGRRAVSAAEALAVAWGLPPASTLARRKLDGRITSLGQLPPRPAITSSSHSFLANAARCTDLLLYTTRSQLLSPDGLALREIDVPELVTSREAGLIFRAGALLSPVAEAVAERLADACRADPVN
jgi:LysR family transcriptional regulator of gallate degradation